MFQNKIEILESMNVYEHSHVPDKILVELNHEMFLLLYYSQKAYNKKNIHLDYLNSYLMVLAKIPKKQKLLNRKNNLILT